MVLMQLKEISFQLETKIVCKDAQTHKLTNESEQLQTNSKKKKRKNKRMKDERRSHCFHQMEHEQNRSKVC